MNRSTTNIDVEDLDNFFITLDQEYWNDSETWKDFKHFVKCAIEEIKNEENED